MNTTSPEPAIARDSRRPRRRLLIGAIVVAGVLLLLLANAHLFHVAVTSQPECVPHTIKAGGASGTYRAAKSAC